MAFFASKRNQVITALAALFVVYSGATMTVVEEGQEAALTGEVVFDPTTAATNFWQNNSPKYFEDKAVPLTTILSEAQGDFSKIASKYGRYSMGDSGELSFIVKGSGTINVVKNKLRSGYLGITLDDYSGSEQIRLQIGPVFKGSAVRDTIDLISYKDYKNQIEWAQVSVALHNLITSEVLGPIDMATTEGKKVEFVGCFTVARANQILVTPVELKIN